METVISTFNSDSWPPQTAALGTGKTHTESKSGIMTEWRDY